MKNLMHYLELDPVTGEHSFTSRNSKYRIDPEDIFFDLPKTTRFRNDPWGMRTHKRSHRVRNPFKDTHINSNQLL